MKIFAAFPSKYLKAADLHDKHVQAIMGHVALEELANKDGAELLPILYFNGVPKGMVLNKTNAKAIAAAYGDETDAWQGMPIVLFPAMVAFGAETVEAIRVKAPSAASRIKASSESPHREAIAHHMVDQFGQRPMSTAWVAPDTSEAAMERARQVFATRKPTPRPVVHDADGVIWDDTTERPPTEAERRELLTEQLRESLRRGKAALEERGAANPDGLDIPAVFDRRAKPNGVEASWIELAGGAP